MHKIKSRSICSDHTSLPCAGSTSNYSVHITNIQGTGATRLVQSLLPELESCAELKLTDLYLPDRGEIASYTPTHPYTRATNYKRTIPNSISRILECLLKNNQFDTQQPLLVLGDLPLRVRAKQILFVHSPHIVKRKTFFSNFRELKYHISQLIFQINLKFVDAFVVQTELMKQSLSDRYHIAPDKIHVIPQPVPSWLQTLAPLKRLAKDKNEGYHFIYPAAYYPHKNHQLLNRIYTPTNIAWPIKKLTLTISPENNPAQNFKWIQCVGPLQPADMVQLYKQADALLFLSNEESFGFPLIEAMHLKLPIVCPDLPYARELCGNAAFYFDPKNPSTLTETIQLVTEKMYSGWQPDYSLQMRKIPSSWSDVAQRMLAIISNPIP